MSWDHLPTELRSEIVSYLELPRVDRDCLWAPQEFLDNRSALRNLCLASRSTAAEARPWLYRRIILYIDGDDVDFSISSPALKVDRHVNMSELPKVPYAGPDSMVQLIRTLIHNPHLRTYIKYVACPFSLSDIPPSSYTEQLEFDMKMMCSSWKRHAHEFTDTSGVERRILDMAGLSVPLLNTPSCDRAEEVGENDGMPLEHEDKMEEVPQRLISVLLCLLPEVDTLLLQSCDRRPSEVTNRIITQCLKDEKIASSVLPKLTTLDLRVHQLRWKRMRERDAIPFDAVYALLHLPTLRHIATWQDDGFASFFEIHRPQQNGVAAFIDSYGVLDNVMQRPRNSHREWLPKIETMSLTTAGYHCSYFYAACEMSTSLRRLTLDVIDVNRGGHFKSEFHSDATLNTSLLLRAETLEELRLGHFSYKHNHIGGSGQLTHLPSMKKLHTLNIEMHMLFGPYERIQQLSLPDLLPPNLERLELGDVWSHGFNDPRGHMDPLSIDWYPEALAGQLKKLAEAARPTRGDQRSMLPKLCSVHLRPHHLCLRSRWLLGSSCVISSNCCVRSGLCLLMSCHLMMDIQGNIE
ncbi:hypothetical protein PG990_010544 [Apiospora arundinis]